MRSAALFAGGLIAGVVATVLVGWTPGERGSRPDPEPRTSADERDRRIARLEDELRDARARLAAGATSTVPGVDDAHSSPSPEETDEEAGTAIDVDALLSALYQDQGGLLSELVSDVLARGAEGFPVLEEFLQRVASEHQGLGIFRRPKLAMPLVGVLLARDAEVAAFAEFFLGQDAAHALSLSAEVELIDLLMTFLVWDVDRHPELRRRLAEWLTSRIRNPDRNFAHVLRTLRALGAAVDTRSLRELLSDRDLERHHHAVIRELAGRDSPEAVLALREFVEGQAGRPEDPSLAAALHALARMREPAAAGALGDFMQARDPAIRDRAVVVYFSVRRDLDALPVALDLLNRSADDASKRALIWQLGSVNPDLLEALRADSGAIEDPELRGFVERTMRWSETAGPAAIELLGRLGAGIGTDEPSIDDGARPDGGNPSTDR